jgi:hypothetical protein
MIQSETMQPKPLKENISCVSTEDSLRFPLLSYNTAGCAAVSYMHNVHKQALHKVRKLFNEVGLYQYSKTNEMHFLYSIYYELAASTCLEHYLLIFRRRCTNNNWYRK